MYFYMEVYISAVHDTAFHQSFKCKHDILCKNITGRRIVFVAALSIALHQSLTMDAGHYSRMRAEFQQKANKHKDAQNEILSAIQLLTTIATDMEEQEEYEGKAVRECTD